MVHVPKFLIDPRSGGVAALDVHFRDGHFEGRISLEATPPGLCRLFERFEEVVESQMFRLLDDVEGEIDAIRLRVAFEDGTEAAVYDLQVFPSTRGVSFTTARSWPSDDDAGCVMASAS